MRYLKYWFNPQSIVDPQTFQQPHYGVEYDWLRHPTVVAEFDADRQLISRTVFQYRWLWLMRADTYAPSGELLRYSLWKYNGLGLVRGVAEHAPDGALLRFTSEDL